MKMVIIMNIVFNDIVQRVLAKREKNSDCKFSMLNFILLRNFEYDTNPLTQPLIICPLLIIA